MISQNTSEALGPPTRGPGADPAAPPGAPTPGKACAYSPDAAAPERGRGKLFTWPLIIGIIVTAALVVGSLFVGAYDIFGNEDGAEMFQITRVPRAIALVLAGAAMGMCGLLMQLITQNRFVEPTTTGTTEWAGLGLLLPVLARWAGELPWMPFQGPLRLLGSLDAGWLVWGRPLAGAVLGVLVAAWVVTGSAVLHVSDEQVRVERRGQVERIVRREQVDGVHRRGSKVVLVSAQGRELFADDVEGPKDAVRTAFVGHGYPWEGPEG